MTVCATSPGKRDVNHTVSVTKVPVVTANTGYTEQDRSVTEREKILVNSLDPTCSFP
jgi:hypothetical protein